MRRFVLLILLLFGSSAAPIQAGALHDAAKEGSIPAIVAALDAGAKVNERDGLATPLSHAVRRGHLEAAKLLIARGADVNAPTDYWGEPLRMAVISSRLDLIELLLANGAIPDSTFEGETALHAAARLGCLDCVKALVWAGADVNGMTFGAKDCSTNRTPLHFAIRFGFPEIAGFLLAHGAIVPKPAPLGSQLAMADAGKGKFYFAEKCGDCHTAAPGPHGIGGPNLWGVAGRAKAALAGANYSKTLRAWGGSWTDEDLNVFLFGPTLTVPGVSMETEGIEDPATRADVIAYLHSLSDKRAQLP